MCVGGTVAVLISNIDIRLLGEELSLKKESCKNAKGYQGGMSYDAVTTHSYPGIDCLFRRQGRATGTE